MNNCQICKKNNTCRQTAFICEVCEVPLSWLDILEQILWPRDCFRKYHENIFVSLDFSTINLDGVESYNGVNKFEKISKAKC